MRLRSSVCCAASCAARRASESDCASAIRARSEREEIFAAAWTNSASARLSSRSKIILATPCCATRSSSTDSVARRPATCRSTFRRNCDWCATNS
eukprot:scaffold125672_cov34-Tisochrysis_lutea.AAC.1